MFPVRRSLRDLDCGYNEIIAALDLSRCKKLERVDCAKNRIAEARPFGQSSPGLRALRTERIDLAGRFGLYGTRIADVLRQ